MLQIATTMAEPRTPTVQMAAYVSATTILKGLIAGLHLCALRNFIALHTELQGTLMPQMAATALARTDTKEQTVRFHLLALSWIIAMGMPLSMGIWQMHMEQQPTWIAPMDACATALMAGLAPTARSHQFVKLPPTAVAMVKPMIRTTPMVAHVCVPISSGALNARIRQSATSARIVLVAAQPRTQIAPMVVIASAMKVFVEQTVPFHWLVTEKFIVMGMQPWTLIAGMDACATVDLGGEEMTAK